MRTKKPEKRKNVYMGPDSVAQIPIRGKVDSVKEIAMNLYATCYDLYSDKKLLTHIPGQEIKARVNTLRGRFYVLRLLALRNGHKHLLPIIDHAEQLSIAFVHGAIHREAYIHQIRALVSRFLAPHEMHLVEAHIKRAERL